MHLQKAWLQFHNNNFEHYTTVKKFSDFHVNLVVQKTMKLIQPQ